MPTIKTRLSKEAKVVVEDWHTRIGNRPAMVSEDLQKALLAACVMSALIRNAPYEPERAIKDYADLYFEARTALLLNNGDSETDRLVAEKFGL